jgi:hypothetical protein
MILGWHTLQLLFLLFALAPLHWAARGSKLLAKKDKRKIT